MQTLSVVPIFVNAGAAVLPAIIIGTASILANLFRPKELARICREKPLAPIGILAVLAAAGFGIFWLIGGHEAQAAKGDSSARATSGFKDWSAIAIDTLQKDPHFLDPPVVDPLAEPLVLGQDYSRSGHASGNAPEKLIPLWQHTEGKSMFLSSPLVAGERVYAASNRPSAGYSTGVIYCLDARSGRPIWQTSAGRDKVSFKPFFSSPAITADRRFLLIGQGLHVDRDCALLCLDAVTGNVLWKVPTPLHLESSPAIYKDIVVIGAGAIEKDHVAVGDPGFVIGVRISDGKLLWRQAVNDPESSPAIDEEGIAYIGSGVNGKAVVALRTEPDEELQKQKLQRIVWSMPAPFAVTSTVTLADDLVIVGCSNCDYANIVANPVGSVLALERKTGQIRWQRPIPVLAPMAFRNGKLICPGLGGEVTALNVKDGAPLWTRKISETSALLAGVCFTEKWIYAASRDGFLAVLDASDGKVIDKNIRMNKEGEPGEGFSISTPTVADARLFIGSETGGLRCYGQRKGE